MKTPKLTKPQTEVLLALYDQMKTHRWSTPYQMGRVYTLFAMLHAKELLLRRPGIHWNGRWVEYAISPQGIALALKLKGEAT